MTAKTIPTYSVSELNKSIGNLIERGFSPKFIVEGVVSKPQLKKGHLWFSLTDEKASVSAVAWSSIIPSFSYLPKDGDWIFVIGKVNFWTKRATLNVQVFDIRPSLKTVMRKFEEVKKRLDEENIFDVSKKRKLPKFPLSVAILTSVPSSALSDILKTASERWPMTQLIIVSIPVQGSAAGTITNTINTLGNIYKELHIDAMVLARGGGEREDLSIFDDEKLCRALAACPIPLITGIGHEDDITIADLVADYRAATPTGAIVALLPSREAEFLDMNKKRQRLKELMNIKIDQEQKSLLIRKQGIKQFSPDKILKGFRSDLNQKNNLLKALSPDRWLKRGLIIVKDKNDTPVISCKDIFKGDKLVMNFCDGTVLSEVESVESINRNQ